MRGMAAALGLGILLALGGCASTGTTVARVSAPASVPASADEASARAGDAEAQYRVGMGYCCSLGRAGSHDTRQATAWLCKAARRDHAASQYALGQIYAGQPVKGAGMPGPQAAGQPTDLSEALLWYRLGGVHGLRYADEAADALAATMSHEQLVKAGRLESRYPDVPCEWDDVFPDHKL
ncbi:MAG: hypothetical protein PW790_01825 [Parvibaculaceae bacterium]|nr:hypothetical protein [Parvibaculaceae bacterium]